MDNNADSHKMHENDTGRTWTKHDLGGSCSKLGFASLLHTAYLSIVMSRSLPQDLCPTDSPTTNGHPTHVAGTHLQRKRSLDNAATKASRLIRRWAIMDQTGRQKFNGTQTGGEFSGKTKLSGYTTLFGTREQSCYASSHVSFVRRDSPPRAQI